MKVSLQTQISTVQREIDMRRKTYGRLVSAGKMRRAEADLAIDHMEAVLNTLVWLRTHEPAIRDRVLAAGGEMPS